MLKSAANYKMWNYHIVSSITAMNYEHLLNNESQNNTETEIAKAIYACIVNNINDMILANYIHFDKSIPSLMKALEDCFNPKTVQSKAIDKSALFVCRDHVKHFGQMLDKLEEAYAILSANGEPPRDSTYKAAILLATPEQYQHIVNTIIQSVDAQNKGKKC